MPERSGPACGRQNLVCAVLKVFAWLRCRALAISSRDKRRRESHEQKRRYTAHPIVRQTIDRDYHVPETNLGVISHHISTLTNGYAALRVLPRACPCWFYTDGVAPHGVNHAEYEAAIRPRYEIRDAMRRPFLINPHSLYYAETRGVITFRLCF